MTAQEEKGNESDESKVISRYGHKSKRAFSPFMKYEVCTEKCSEWFESLASGVGSASPQFQERAETRRLRAGPDGSAVVVIFV
jgi:hypothetical protein